MRPTVYWFEFRIEAKAFICMKFQYYNSGDHRLAMNMLTHNRTRAPLSLYANRGINGVCCVWVRHRKSKNE